VHRRQGQERHAAPSPPQSPTRRKNEQPPAKSPRRNEPYIQILVVSGGGASPYRHPRITRITSHLPVTEDFFMPPPAFPTTHSTLFLYKSVAADAGVVCPAATVLPCNTVSG
jgi:hypothetical protein